MDLYIQCLFVYSKNIIYLSRIFKITYLFFFKYGMVIWIKKNLENLNIC